MGTKYTYNMWNTDFFSLTHKFLEKEPFTFKDKNGTRNSFKIEELDLITSKYESFDSFYNALAKFGNKYVDGKNRNIIITHTHNGNLYSDEMIFNDKMVAKIASQVINKENTKDSLPIPASSSLSYFISYIEDIAISSQYKYLLMPERIIDISPYDVNVLKNCIKKDIVSNDKVVKKGIHSLLSDYREAYFKNEECIKSGESNIYTQSELDKLRDQINRCVRSNYKVFRDLVAWENRYIKILNKNFMDEKDNNEKLRIFRLIEDVSMEKELRDGKIDNSDLYKYYTIYRKRIGIDSNGKIFVNNIDDEIINNNIHKQMDRVSSFGRK